MATKGKLNSPRPNAENRTEARMSSARQMTINGQGEGEEKESGWSAATGRLGSGTRVKRRQRDERTFLITEGEQKPPWGDHCLPRYS